MAEQKQETAAEHYGWPESYTVPETAKQDDTDGRKVIGNVFFIPEVKAVGEGKFTLTIDADTLDGILYACKQGQEWMAECCGIYETRWDDLTTEIQSNPEFCKELETAGAKC
jgi:hypothetical protein